MTMRTTAGLVSLIGLVLGVAACTSDNDPVVERGVFESDSPGGNSKGANGNLTADGAVPQTTATGTAATDDGAAEADRAIEEADIIKIEGTRLYALSQYGGLSVIDISTRDQMRLLGRKRVQAQPFEMYVRDSIVFALYNGYGEYVKGTAEGSWNWVTTSSVLAFDTTDPANPTTVGRFSIPGTIQDSRIVGDAMYVVGFEANGCWGCAEGQHTTVISLDISTPNAISKVAERSYADDTTSTYSWKRSITVTDKRMYIAGPEWGTSGEAVGSAIQVVDISDPKGALVDGVKVSAAGRIDSRWQMDETGGVLRVISQPGNWRPSDPPRIQTFSVASAQVVTPLASVNMVVPAGEDLRSVRFDGPRGYAITAIQTDPLFTIDLSDATQPKQVGALEMPGWVYFMEPRGERLVSLGYDQGNAAGALAVSLFDVSNLATPTLLDRVNFGGNWSWISEDQDRVHKAFQVLDSANLILMPFSGSYYSATDCYDRYQSGVQLIDWAADQLTLLGVATTVGQARRGFLHDTRLFTMSDERVETFDIADRSQPKATDALKLTQKVSYTVDAGTAVVKVGQDWYSDSVQLETTTLDAVENVSANGQIDVKIGVRDCNSWSNLNQVVAKNGKVYLLTDIYNYDSTAGTSTHQTELTTVDVTNPAAPTVVGDALLDFGESWSYWYGGVTVAAGQTAVMAGDAIVALGSTPICATTSTGANECTGNQSTLHVIDPTDPAAPSMKSIKLPSSIGTTGLLASGTSVALGHYVQSPANPNRVRFFVDRLDVSDPTEPVLQPPVNVPGSPVAYDAASSNIVSVDYREILTAGLTNTQCHELVASAWFEYPENNYSDTALGTCHAMQHTLYLVALGDKTATALGSKALPIGQRVTKVAAGDDRVFLSVGANYYYYGMGGAAVDCMDCGGIYGYSSLTEAELPLYVAGGLKSGEFAVGKATLAGGDYWSYSPMVASGQRVLLSTGWRGKLAVVDGSDVEKPVLVREEAVIGSTQSLTAINGIGIASLYYDGVQTIRIKD